MFNKSDCVIRDARNTIRNHRNIVTAIEEALTNYGEEDFCVTSLFGDTLKHELNLEMDSKVIKEILDQWIATTSRQEFLKYQASIFDRVLMNNDNPDLNINYYRRLGAAAYLWGLGDKDHGYQQRLEEIRLWIDYYQFNDDKVFGLDSTNTM